jgi:hypothetical protein
MDKGRKEKGFLTYPSRFVITLLLYVFFVTMELKLS